MTVRRLRTYTDDRGRLLVAEDAEIGFPIRRVFAITASPEGTMRGEHAVPCHQVMVLVAGAARVWTGETEPVEHLLAEPGDAVDLATGVWVRYALSSAHTVVLVFAESPFQRNAAR